MLWAKIIAALFFAFLLSAYQYLHKKKSWPLWGLRFLVYFILFLLLFGLSFSSRREKIIKPDLYVLVDQSQSISNQGGDQNVKKIIDSLKESYLNKKFNIHWIGFGKDFFSLDSLNFNEKETDINRVLKNMEAVYGGKLKKPVILLSDGINTSGETNLNAGYSLHSMVVYPVVLGDTTHYDNLSIREININPIAFKGNKFPVEIYIEYKGNKPVNTLLNLRLHKKKVFSKSISFIKPGLKKINFSLPANSLGNQIYHAEILPLKNEKNRKDNYKRFSIEVIDQKKKIAIISSIVHPDIGAIKRQLAKNKYIQTDFFLIDKAPASLSNYSSVILYQPTALFSRLFRKKAVSESNWFIITGPHTDWAWLNKQHLFFNKMQSSLKEEYFPIKNPNFTLFEIPKLSFDKYPPLIDSYGQVSSKNAEIALYATINGIKTDQGLLVFNKSAKQAVLLGENIWQWNMYAHKLNEENRWTDFFQQLIQYVSENKTFRNIRLSYKVIYYEGEPIEIKANILNKNMAPDLRDKPVITIYNSKLQKIYQAPLLLSDKHYKIQIEALPPGEYSFVLKSQNNNKTKSGSFEVSRLNKEKIVTRSDLSYLKEIAKKTNGQVYFPNHTHQLISFLNRENIFPAHIKNIDERHNLINIRYLLFILILLLGIEWLYKKLRGEI